MTKRFSFSAVTTLISLCVTMGLFWTQQGACRAGESGEPAPPVVVTSAAGSMVVPAPGGGVDMIFSRSRSDGVRENARRRSFDNGKTWSEPETLLKLPAPKFGTPLPLLTQSGELQLFWMVRRGSGKVAVDYFIDIWNAYSTDGQTEWSEPKRIFDGYVGSINGMTQLRSGRIVVPFAYWVGGRASAPPTGSNITTTVYSDDGGRTWHQSPAKLTAPCYPDYNGSNYGACEPTILQLADGRVWMLARTQTGWLYESFSPDGSDWSELKPSQFRSSNSPGSLVRLPDDRIVLLWNNCENTSRIDGKGVYTNRDALHAAISDDEGKTWIGYREICRDPFRNEPPPKRGDRGTAYPHAIASQDGMILCVTGQGHGRRNLLRIDPDWLEETEHEDDFSDGLEEWSVFTSFGEPVGYWRNRRQGAHLVDHPTNPEAKCLHVRRAEEKPGDGAVWDFPAGKQGQLTLKLRLNQGFQGGSIALADRFIQPTDDAGAKKVLFKTSISPDGELTGGEQLETERWYTVELAWDLETEQCRVLIDGEPAAELQQSGAPCAGISYLLLRSTADTVDPAGFLVERVSVEVTP